MTTPTTPTGKDFALDEACYGHDVTDVVGVIEHEAAAQERASLLEEHCAGHDDTDGPCEMCVLLRAKT